jgi:hypothetical protein
MRQMFNRSFVALAALAVVSAVAPAAQAASASDTANANATIIDPIAIAKQYDLDFGAAAPGALAGTVVMAPSGSRSSTGGVSLSNLNNGAAASFLVSGQANANYAITLPGSIVLNGPGLNTMTADTFTSNPSLTGNLGVGGSQTVNVGATLNVAANQVAGSYTGTFVVSVDYL